MKNSHSLRLPVVSNNSRVEPIRCLFNRIRILPVTVALCLASSPSNVQGQEALTNGNAHDGGIEAIGEMDTWTITASEGERFTVQLAELTGGAGFTPKLEMLSPEGATLGTDVDGVVVRLDIQAPVTGTFSAVVSDASGTGTGTYRLHFAKVPGAFEVPVGDEGGALSNGQDHDGTIALGDLDLWTVDASAGDRISVQVTELTGGAGFAPQLEVISPEGTRLGFMSGSVTARLDLQVREGGTYSVLVTDANQTGTGTYRLRLAQVPGSFVVPGGDDGGALTDVVNHDGTVAVGDVDIWTFGATSGELVTLALTELTGGAGFTPKIELFGPAGVWKADGQGAAGTTLAVATEDAGTYTVLVSDATPAGTGTYRLTLNRSSLVPSGEGLVNGTSHLGSISPAADLDTWTFLATAGENIVVRGGETTTGAFNPWLRLYGPDGTLLDSSFGTVAAEVAFRATNSGVFSVTVADGSSGGQQTGNYRLSLAKTGNEPAISVSDEGGPLVNGTTYLATIEAGDIDAWTFTANTGENLLVRAGETTGGSPLSPWLRLYGPNGALLDSSFGTVAAEVAFRATNSGTFLVVMGDGNNGFGGTGNYRLSLAVMPERFSTSASDDGGAVSADSSIPGEITTGDIDIWSFEANQGNSLVIRMVELVGPGLSPWLRVYGTDGQLIGQNFSTTAAQVSFVAPQSGLYTVVASDGNNGFGGTGTYELTVSGLPVQGKQLRYEQPTSDSLLINWPSELTGYVLQQNPVLSPTGWEDVELFPVDNGFNVRLIVPIEPIGNRFFRLRLP
jgi:predicted RNA-binding protein with TRAM domain